MGYVGAVATYLSISTRVASAARVELLPRSCFKYPAGRRLNHYATDVVQVRAFYRFYNDNFGNQAHTAEVKLPVKVTPFFVLYPFCRYHRQTATDYLAPFLQHFISNEYYTSDYDLSAFSASKVGLGLRYSPVYGITRFRVPGPNPQGLTRVMRLKSLDLRHAHCQRSTDLVAHMARFDLALRCRR